MWHVMDLCLSMESNKALVMVLDVEHAITMAQQHLVAGSSRGAGPAPSPQLHHRGRGGRGSHRGQGLQHRGRGGRGGRGGLNSHGGRGAGHHSIKAGRAQRETPAGRGRGGSHHQPCTTSNEPLSYQFSHFL